MLFRSAGQMQVRVTTAAGGVSNHSVPVTISAAPIDDGSPAAATDVAVSVISTDDVAGTSEVSLTWTPTDDRATTWAVALDGIVVGRTDQTTVTVADIRRGADVTLSVAGITSGDMVGESAETVLAALVPPVVTPPPTPGPTVPPAPPETPDGPAPAPSTGPVAAPVPPGPVSLNLDAAATRPAPSVNAPVRATAKGGRLPATGSEVLVLVVTATALVGAGVIVLVRRRRRVGS